MQWLRKPKTIYYQEKRSKAVEAKLAKARILPTPKTNLLD
jgi:hypothetical protein